MQIIKRIEGVREEEGKKVEEGSREKMERTAATAYCNRTNTVSEKT